MTENVALPYGEKQAAKSVTDDLIVDGEFKGLDPAPQSSAGGAGVGNAVDSRRTNTNTIQAICGAVRRSERLKSRRTTSLNAAFPDGSGRAAGVPFSPGLWDIRRPSLCAGSWPRSWRAVLSAGECPASPSFVPCLEVAGPLVARACTV